MTNNRIQRYTVSGDIAYPIHEDPEGDYVTYEDHVAAIEADRKRRGEPVAWEKAFDDAKKVAHLYNSGTGILGYMQQQYANHTRNAPQPVDPESQDDSVADSPFVKTF